MLKGAVIGLGNVAVKGHIPAWLARTDVRITAAVDTDQGRRKCLAGPLARMAWYSDVAEMIDRERLDFVDICTPPAMHADLVRLALAAKLHVLCEKPLVTSVEDLRSIVHLARKYGRALHTVHNWLHAAPLRAITAAIAAGEIGGVRHVNWQTLRTRPAAGARNWRIDRVISGGGILYDHGWHALYCVARWMGARPRTVSARLETRRFVEWDLEDTATLVLEAGTVRSQIFLTWTAGRRANRVEVTGENGRLVLEGATLRLERVGRPPQTHDCAAVLSEGSHHPDWFAGVVSDFFSAIRAEAPDRAANLDEAVLCAKLIEGAIASDAAGGRPVAVPMDQPGIA